MNSLIVCLPRSVTSEDVRDQLLASQMSVEFRDNRITVSYEGALAWIERDSDGELERQYEPNEASLVSGLLGRWVGFIIDYRSIEVAAMTVAAMCERWPCVVDDEDEFLGWGREYLERLRAEGSSAR